MSYSHPVTELRATGKSEDGNSLTLTDSASAEYTLRISDSLRSLVNQQRLTSVPDDDAPRLSIKEIQSRLRSGESAENIARDADLPLEKIERFSGPIIQERRHIIDTAQNIIVERDPNRDPLTFGNAVNKRLAPRQIDAASLEWSTWRLEDASWIIRLTYPNRDGSGTADWSFDASRKVLEPLDEDAEWFAGGEISPFSNVTTTTGVIHPSAPRVIIDSAPIVQPVISQPLISQLPVEPTEMPRLVSIRPEEDESLTSELDDEEEVAPKRASVPTWDEIMFGTTRKSEDE